MAGVAAALAAAAFFAAPALAGVVITEIHYHPPSSEPRALEFVEVHNPGPGPAALGGYRLVGEADFTFPEGTVLEEGEYLAVCRKPELAQAHFGGPSSAYIGPFEGALENAGETLVLVDAFNAVADAVEYDDRLPWPEDADGGEDSLQRLCVTSRAQDPLNWTADSPSPGKDNEEASCPPPEYVTPRIVFSEIHYHPLTLGSIHPALEDGEDEEFVELHNPGTEPVDLGGWSLADGINFVFEPGTVIPPGEFLAVCRNAAAVRQRFGIAAAVGDYDGRLSNQGERVALLDDFDRWVDSVRYSESGGWPYGADGLGPSLEKVALGAPGDDPGNWRLSELPTDKFVRVSGEGKLASGLSQRFLISLDGPGEAIVDEVILENVAQPGQNLLSNGGFDAGIEGWRASGIAASSSFAAGAGETGTGALRLVSTGLCDGECGSGNSVSASLPGGLDRNARYRATIVFRHVRGSSLVKAGLFQGATASLSRMATPGTAGAGSDPIVPPSISRVRRFPIEPRPADPVWITAKFQSAEAPAATLIYEAGAGTLEVAMADDGAHHDGAAGDGVFGAALPPQPHNTQVRFRIRLLAEGRLAEHPRPRFPEIPLASEWDGYYVDGLQANSPLPVYHVLIRGVGEAPEAINAALDCTILRPASFAVNGDLYPEVGLRFRGNTACVIKKRNLKVVFNRGRLFHGLRKLNLNGIWTDKALVRERLAWEFLREIGVPYCYTAYARVHLNGRYHGLFLEVEHPDERFLQRNGLDDAGNLYKALQPFFDDVVRGVELQPTLEGYRAFWTEEANEGGDFTDLADFINDMHRDGTTGGGPTVEFWSQKSLEELIVGYQLGQVVLNNIDSFAKNHFLYHDLKSDRWGFLTWDLDLVFGKFFYPDAVGPGREVGTLNDFMLSDPEVGGDLDPWFAAQVNGGPLLNHVVDYFFRAGGNHYQRAYLVRLWSILEETYRNDVYDPRLDALHSFLAAEEAADHARWGRYPTNVAGYPEDMTSNIEIIKNQLKLHRDYLRNYVLSNHPQASAAPRIRISEVMYWPEKGNENLEFLELVNVGTKPVDLEGWTVSGLQYEFPQDSVVAENETFILARSPQAFAARYPDLNGVKVFGPYDGKLANEGEEIRILDAGPGFPATIDYLRYESDAPWPEVAPGFSIELVAAGPGGSNDEPVAWRLSPDAGGSPGSAAEPRFRRGDADLDGEVSVTDAVTVLFYLFLAGDAPVCMDAADVDDGGLVDVSDTVGILNYLFLGGAKPSAPGPEVCGPDPSRDDLPACGASSSSCGG